MEFLGSTDQPVDHSTGIIMYAMFYKVYCYRDSNGPRQKQIWYEVECMTTGNGISWSPDKNVAIEKAIKLGYVLYNPDKYVIRMYRTKEKA